MAMILQNLLHPHHYDAASRDGNVDGSVNDIGDSKLERSKEEKLFLFA
jgi:hypothetical protein